MKRTAAIVTWLALCGAAAWTGDRLGRSSPAAEVTATSPDVATAQGGGTAGTDDALEANDLKARRVMSACDSDALWDWLKAARAYQSFQGTAAEELLDRFGVAAVATALEIPDLQVRARLTELLLRRLVKRDPAAALEILRQRHDDLPPGVRYTVANRLLEMAGAVSADHLIATYDALPGDEPPIPGGFNCPQGFDFGKVLDHMAATEKQLPLMAPQLLHGWGRTASVAAARWLAGHAPEKPYSMGPMDDPGDPVATMIKAIAASGQPDRREAYEALMPIPEAVREEAWKSINDAAVNGPLDRERLEAATAMGVRDDYLMSVLQGTRYRDEPDAGWSEVPAEERTTLLAREAEKWAKQQPVPPIAEKIHADWRARLEEQWRQQLKK